MALFVLFVYSICREQWILGVFVSGTNSREHRSGWKALLVLYPLAIWTETGWKLCVLFALILPRFAGPEEWWWMRSLPGWWRVDLLWWMPQGFSSCLPCPTTDRNSQVMTILWMSVGPPGIIYLAGRWGNSGCPPPTLYSLQLHPQLITGIPTVIY